MHSGVTMGDRKLEQRINITFCLKIAKWTTETLQLLRLGYSENAMKCRVYLRFKEGREDSDRYSQKRTLRQATRCENNC